jgi:hypothetical protein
MIILQIRRASAPDNATELFPKFLAQLPEGLKPLISPTLQSQASILGLPIDTLRARTPKPNSEFEYRVRPITRMAELLTDGTSLFLVRLTERVQPRRPLERRQPGSAGQTARESELSLFLYHIGPQLDPPTLAQLESIANTQFGTTLQPYYYLNKAFDDLASEGRVPPTLPTANEKEGSHLLRDRAARTLAIAIKASGGLLVRDLEKQLPPPSRGRTRELTELLRAACIVDSEIVVVCTKTQAQTARVASMESLQEMASRGLKCACGRPVSDERIEEAVSITDFGRSLLDRSRWLNIVILEELAAVGIPMEKVLLEQQAGGDELDLLANISGELALFELKDKEFNLGNAYSFGAKIGIIQPKHPVIVSTEHVGNDAKDHFQRARLVRASAASPYATESETIQVRYIEGLDSLTIGIQALASDIYSADARRILDEVLPLALVDSAALVSSFGTRGN